MYVALLFSSDHQLTVHEVEALGDLARGSSVVREKAELAKLQSIVEHVDASPKSSSQSGGDSIMHPLTSAEIHEGDRYCLAACITSLRQ